MHLSKLLLPDLLHPPGFLRAHPFLRHHLRLSAPLAAVSLEYLGCRPADPLSLRPCQVGLEHDAAGLGILVSHHQHVRLVLLLDILCTWIVKHEVGARGEDVRSGSVCGELILLLMGLNECFLGVPMVR